MAISYKGLFSAFSAEKHTALYKLVNGIEKSTRKKSCKPPSMLQLAQNKKFGMANALASKIKNMLDMKIVQTNKKLSPTNISVKQILKETFLGEYPDYRIDYGKVMITNGSHHDLNFTHAELLTREQLGIEWYHRHSKDKTDFICIVIYSEWLNEFYHFKRIARKEDQIIFLDLPKNFIGEALHCWIFATDEIERHVSRSRYIGEIPNNVR